MSDDADNLHRLGLSRLSAGDVNAAETLIRRSIALRPKDARYHANLGSLLGSTGKLDKAIAELRRAIELNPGYAEAHRNLGVALERKGELAEAATAYERAIELRPDHGPSHGDLGEVFAKLRRVDEAVACHRRAVQLMADDADAHARLASALWQRGDQAETVSAYRRALQLRPESASDHSALLFVLRYGAEHTPALRLDETKAWAARHAAGAAPLAARHCEDRSAGARVRIAYVSPDFIEHPAARILLPILRNHDREKFEVFCYSSVSRPDRMTDTIRSLADGWREIRHLSDDQAAGLIRDDRVDILIDLSGHMSDSRLLVFARKPAPVQITFTYCGTTGLAQMDYRITDEHSDPTGIAEAQHVEKLLRLPCAWPYDPGELPDVGELPALRNGYVTFACFNQAMKVTDHALDVWSRILELVPRSRLMLASGSVDGKNSFLAGRLRRLGIEGRCDLAPLVPRAAYLERFNQVDIALDPFPYNGEATTLDGLWMGVPLVTLEGDSCVSRRGVSHLRTLGLAELIAGGGKLPICNLQFAIASAQTSASAVKSHSVLKLYASIARELANDLARLAELRRTLRERIRASLLGDGPRYTRLFELALLEEWLARMS